jgi:dTDP-4-dehydrorhamnose 3,5-epimerase
LKFTPTKLPGAYVIEIDRSEDARGFFARLWCKEEFKQQGIRMEPVQVSVSHNPAPGTLRGLHFQWPPSTEAKLVRCQRGRIYDVIVDLRPDSPTFTQHVTVNLDDREHNSLYIPPGFAHGFQTLEANTDILYMMSDFYRPDLQDGVRHDDPAFGISWPLPLTSISDRDRDYPDFDPDSHTRKFNRALVSKNPNGLL